MTQLDIELEGESHTITSTGTGEDRVYTYNDAEIDLTDIQTAIEALTADSFTTEAATGQEEIALTLHLDNEDFPTVTIRLTRYDGSLCLAEVDGESVCLVSRSARHGPGGGRAGHRAGRLTKPRHPRLIP